MLDKKINLILLYLIPVLLIINNIDVKCLKYTQHFSKVF